MTDTQRIERTIHVKYRKTIWRPFVGGIKKYGLICENDRIACCISGGKDSMLMALLLKNLHRFSTFPFELTYIVMNPGYSADVLEKIRENARILDIPIHIFDSNIFEVVGQTDRSPCYLCAKMRRGFLYSEAQRLGCNKIALGHHFNDVVETVLMSLFYGGKFQTMMPKLNSKNYPEMQLIRPMYRVPEDEILAWKHFNQLEFIKCACPLAENCTIWDDGGTGSKRQETKALLKRLKRTNPSIEKNIMNSLHNVNLSTIISFNRAGKT